MGKNIVLKNARGEDVLYQDVSKITVKDTENNPVSFAQVEGTLSISKNGEYDVSTYENLNVDVVEGGINGLQWKCDNVKNCQYEFYSYKGDDSLNEVLESINTENVTSFKYAFAYCSNITNISKLNTKNATDTTYMFASNTNLVSLPPLDLSNSLDTGHMFEYCRALKSVELGNTSKSKNMYQMFYNCSALSSVSGLDTSSATEIRSLFERCGPVEGVLQLDVSKTKSLSSLFKSSSFKSLPVMETSHITDMYDMCYSCSRLETIPILDLYSVTSVYRLVYACTSLKNLTLKNIKINGIEIGWGNSWGHLLTVESLINTIKELWDYSSGETTYNLKMGDRNTPKLADVYVRLIDVTEEMLANDPYADQKMPCEVCESTDDGAMLITDYATLKKWTIA